MPYIIAVDLGTKHTKIVIINEQAQLFQTFKAPVISVQDEYGKHEQDAELIYQSVLELLRQSLYTLNSEDVACICFSAAMHSLLAVDDGGTPLCNALTWADSRSKFYAQQYRATAAGLNIYKYTGTPVHSMSPMYKLLWMKNEIPEIFNKAAKFISIKEYIFYRLFGKYIIDEGIASATGLYNIYDHAWHLPALQLAGIDALKLSTVVPATHIECTLLPQVQNGLGITVQIPFVIGGNDGCLANLGCGAAGHNVAVLTVGTSGAVRLTIAPPQPENANGLFRYLLTDKIYVTGGPVNNGGIVLQWFAENFLGLSLLEKNNIDTIMQLAAEAKPGADDLLFLPYLLGERAPVWNEDATGMFYGLRIRHSKTHLTRAVVEGISFSLLQILKEIENDLPAVQSVYVSGIVTQSYWWMQLIADMFGREIILNNVADASAMGAAFMGMYATGIIKELNEVSKFVQPSKRFVPDAEVHGIYKEKFEIYKQLYPLSKSLRKP